MNPHKEKTLTNIKAVSKFFLECRSKSAAPMEGFTCGNHPTVSVGSQVYIKQSKFNTADERITAILGQSKVSLADTLWR